MRGLLHQPRALSSKWGKPGRNVAEPGPLDTFRDTIAGLPKMPLNQVFDQNLSATFPDRSQGRKLAPRNPRSPSNPLIKGDFMRKLVLASALCAMIATPALANEGRAETRAGVSWGNGQTDATTGIGLGYDIDVGTGTFVGAEVTADKTLTGGTRVNYSFNGRAGIKPTGSDKLYLASGYTTKICATCEGAVNLGSGYEHDFGNRLYGKVEYKHYFGQNGSQDRNTAMAGLGIKF